MYLKFLAKAANIIRILFCYVRYIYCKDFVFFLFLGFTKEGETLVYIQFSIYGGTNDDSPPFFADSLSLQEIVDDPLWQNKAIASRDAERKSELTINIKARRRSPGYTGAKLMVSEYCSLRTLSTQRAVSPFPLYISR